MDDPLRSMNRPGLGRATMGYQPAENDLLSEVLRDLRLAHARYGRSELTAPWGIAVPFREGVRFHAMLEGQCWIQAKSLPPLLLECGDVLLLPHGTEHTMSDRPQRESLATGRYQTGVDREWNLRIEVWRRRSAIADRMLYDRL